MAFGQVAKNVFFLWVKLTDVPRAPNKTCFFRLGWRVLMDVYVILCVCCVFLDIISFA